MKKKRKNSNKQKSLGLFIGLILVIILACTNNLEYILGSDFQGDSLNSNNSRANENYTFFENNGDLNVYFFDVGQADCILVSNSGENMLIDAGNNPDGKLIVDKLKSMNITRIDYLVGTHPHEDHIGGMDDIIENIDIGKIFMPKKTTNTKTYEDVLDAIDDKNLKINAPKVGDVFYVGSAKCEVMGINNTSDELNETSIIIELTYGEKKFLFTGDAETVNEQERSWDDIDVLKVAHHGSRTSTSESFLLQTKPEYAVISLGKDNDYGHPHKEVMERLKNIKVYRTDEDGTILAICDGKNIEFEKLDIDLDGNK